MRDGKLRPVCTECGAVTWLDPKLAVAVIVHRIDEILLGKRAAHTREPGKWSFPAGFVDRGELVEDAARRETFEETGLKVELGPILALLSSHGETVVLAVYAATQFTGDASAGDDFDEIAWCPLANLPTLAFPHDAEIIDLCRTVLEPG
jgi:ADP-ribose pyrophosphatase YjhB (NUDIX family)